MTGLEGKFDCGSFPGVACKRTIRISTVNEQWAAAHIRPGDLPLACTDGTTATVDLGTGPMRYRRSDPSLGLDVRSLTSDPAAPTPSAWRMRAKVHGPRRIDGTLRFYDHEFEVADGSVHDCRTGPLTWSVAD